MVKTPVDQKILTIYYKSVCFIMLSFKYVKYEFGITHSFGKYVDNVSVVAKLHEPRGKNGMDQLN